MSKLHSVY